MDKTTTLMDSRDNEILHFCINSIVLYHNALSALSQVPPLSNHYVVTLIHKLTNDRNL